MINSYVIRATDSEPLPRRTGCGKSARPGLWGARVATSSPTRRTNMTLPDCAALHPGYSPIWRTLPHLPLIADRAEMLVDAEDDQDEFRGDARKHHADHDAGDRGQ